jgi:hypothetical protein
MKTFLLVIISFLAFSCKTEKIMTDAEIAKTEKTDDTRLKIVASLGDKLSENDFYTITSVRLEKNKILIDVNFSGGCAKHDFKAIGLSLNSQSVQPIRQIQLVHLSNNDQCKKLILQTLEIDIKQILVNNGVGSKSIFKIDGWKDQLEYIAQ